MIKKKIVSLQPIMDTKTLIYRLKSWIRFHLTAWNTGGEGVHSPYLFEWIRLIMSDKNGYYIWQEIEACRQNLLQDERLVEFVDYGMGRRVAGGVSPKFVKSIAKNSLASKKYAQMLFRLVNWLGHELQRPNDKGLIIVELGTSLGITTAYLASANSRNKVLTFEGCEDVAKIALESWNQLNISNIECVVGEINVEQLRSILQQVDIAFIDANHTYASTRDYFNVLTEKVHQKSVIVVDDIHHSEEMERAWKEICADERVTTTMDLYQMGLVFFDKHYWNRNYKIRL